MFYLENPIKNYHWGMMNGISQKFGIAIKEKKQAEMWMGAHPNSSSMILDGDKKTSLKEYLEKFPKDFFQENINEKFNNQIPFLFKILCIAEPLSIQCHPNEKQAKNSFGMNPIYKDSFPKEELLCAFTKVQLLCGFRKPLEIYNYFHRAEIFTDFPSLKFAIQKVNFKLFYKLLSTMSVKRKKIFIEKIVTFAKKKSDTACKTILYLYQFYPNDVYISAAFFMNIITLKQGEAIFLEPQIIHSYISGIGFEIMSNSDNVLRVGLTSKETHLHELLKVAKFKTHKAKKIYPIQKDIFNCYLTPSNFFKLKTKKLLQENLIWHVENITIIFCSEGQLEVIQKEKKLSLKKGQSIVLKIGKVSISGNGFLFLATV